MLTDAGEATQHPIVEAFQLRSLLGFGQGRQAERPDQRLAPAMATHPQCHRLAVGFAGEEIDDTLPGGAVLETGRDALTLNRKPFQIDGLTYLSPAIGTSGVCRISSSRLAQKGLQSGSTRWIEHGRAQRVLHYRLIDSVGYRGVRRAGEDAVEETVKGRRYKSKQRFQSRLVSGDEPLVKRKRSGVLVAHIPLRPRVADGGSGSNRETPQPA